MIRTLATLLIASGMAAGLAFAEPPAAPPAPPPAPGAGTPAAPPVPTVPPVPEAPQGLPVPSDLPVVNTQTLDGGLVAEDLKIGEGYEVKPGGSVVAYYHGTLKDGGKVFDSAFERGEPIAFPLSGVIPGWQKGVPGMKVGGIRRLIIPAAMAYGERSPSADIPANADLVFIIQLVDALQIEDLTVGDGEEAGSRPICVTAYTMKGEDGKEIEAATRDKPFIWVPNENQGISMGMEGMKVGGKRRIMIPKLMNKTAPGAPGDRPQDVPLTVEIELLAVKNLVPVQPKP